MNLNENEYFAIKVDQPFGEFYSVSLSSEFLLDVCYSRAAEYIDGDVRGAQRQLKSNRIFEISKFIDSDEASFPNAIILSANYDENDWLVEEENQWRVEEINADKNLYKLVIPTKARICSVVDGQHRLFAFREARHRHMNLTCSVFLSMPSSYQAAIFATINFNQTKVDKSVAYQLFGYQLEDSDRDKWSPDVFGVWIARYFNEEQTPFNDRIKYRLLKHKSKSGWGITLAAFVEGVVKLISKNPKEDRYLINSRSIVGFKTRKSLALYSGVPLRELYVEGNDLAIFQVINAFFKGVDEALWSKCNVDESILTKTVGIGALFDFLKVYLENKDITKHLLNNFYNELIKASDVSFDDERFFTPNSKGRGRLKNILIHKVMGIPIDKIVRSDDLGNYSEYI